ncbi:hypothetical protein A2Z23_00625 [Candidatus Curtissbacteria bacterium RBG_16_39_7]|uniref:Uncharacterized protein n=1 Tax=Candidatus Curtissbacteria bacterium RBG_16_39_7 TaxID=1797707 RepID=A0A1F5G3Q7_9BACT|nr:MAG: hypothetical protein A2Z23_00625 [Candidatus Curtissbacteria bacterium RBG_16_39_7]
MSKQAKILTAASAIFSSVFAGILLSILLPHPFQETLSPQNPIAPPQISASRTTFGDVLSQATKSAPLGGQAASPSAVLAAKTGRSVTIALLGDSMVDTLGRDLSSLYQNLSQYYPKVTFNLLNYGVGAQKAEEALTQLNQEHNYQNQKLPAPLSANPDIVVIESFAYNHPPGTEEGFKSRRLTLAKIISEIKSKTHAEVIVLATIAPNDQIFALDAPGINWDGNQRKIEAQAVRSFIEDAIKYANEAGLPIIDAYTPSLDANKNGKEIYINPVDNIHPSQAGIELVSDLIAQRIQELGLVEKSLAKPTPVP